MKVSIIVPVYNVAGYIDRCLESLINQTHTQIEVLVVDDGSTDQTYQICAEHESRDSRIRVVRQQNSGVSVARNTGLSLATGEWISFVDGDDLLPKYAIERMIALAIEFRADGVCGRYTSSSLALDTDPPSQDPVRILNGREAQTELLYQRTIANAPFAKLFSKDAIGGSRFPAGIPVAEDLAFNYDALSNMHVVALTPTVVYGYMNRADGAISSTKAERRALALTVTGHILEDAHDKGDRRLVAAATSRHFMEAMFVGTRSRWSARRKDCLRIIRANRHAVARDPHAPNEYRAIAMLAGLSPSIALFALSCYGAIKTRFSVGVK